jgi:hypothetical protein
VTETTAPAPREAGPIQRATMDMLRSVLMGVGTPLLARGLVTGTDWQSIVGGGVALTSAVWSYAATHPSKVNPLQMILGLVRAGGGAKAWDADLVTLKPLLVAIVRQEIDAQIKAKAGIMAVPLDGVANAAIAASASKAEAAVTA